MRYRKECRPQGQQRIGGGPPTGIAWTSITLQEWNGRSGSRVTANDSVAAERRRSAVERDGRSVRLVAGGLFCADVHLGLQAQTGWRGLGQGGRQGRMTLRAGLARTLALQTAVVGVGVSDMRAVVGGCRGVSALGIGKMHGCEMVRRRDVGHVHHGRRRNGRDKQPRCGATEQERHAQKPDHGIALHMHGVHASQRRRTPQALPKPPGDSAPPAFRTRPGRRPLALF